MNFPQPWQNTVLQPGPLSNNCYNTDIIGLSANTVYEYRAYFTVSGVTYYGNTLTGITKPIPFTAPVVNTGVASGVTSSGYYVAYNKIISEGGNGISVNEYGILYTKNSAYNTPSTLVVGNVGVNVSKMACTTPYVPSVPYYFNEITGTLPSNCNTYFRAYACNACGVGYGNISGVTTCGLTEVVSICRCYGSTSSSPSNDTGGFFCITPGLSAPGQCITVSYIANHTVFGPGSGQNQTYVYCKKCGTSSFNQISCFTTISPSCAPPDRVCCVFCGCVTMCLGDVVCYRNVLSSTGVCSSMYETTCVDLYLSSVSSTSDMIASISSTSCRDCTFI